MAGSAPTKGRNWRQIIGGLVMAAALALMGWKLASATSERDKAVQKLRTATADYDKAQKESTTSIQTLQTQLKASNQASLDRADQFADSLEHFRLESARIDREASRTDAIIAGMSASSSDMEACRTPQSVIDAVKDL